MSTIIDLQETIELIGTDQVTSLVFVQASDTIYYITAITAASAQSIPGIASLLDTTHGRTLWSVPVNGDGIAFTRPLQYDASEYPLKANFNDPDIAGFLVIQGYKVVNP